MINSVRIALASALLVSSSAAQSGCEHTLVHGTSGNLYVRAIDLTGSEVLMGYPNQMPAGGVIGQGRVEQFSMAADGSMVHTGWIDCPGSPNTSVAYGASVERDGTRLAVSAPNLYVNGVKLGGVYVYERQGADWVLDDTLVPPTQSPGGFGTSLHLQGDYIFVGSPVEGELAFGQGAVHVYRATPQGWSFTQTLTASNAGYSIQGFGLSMDGDANRVVVGAWRYPGHTSVGGVYVFENTGGVWSEAKNFSSPPTVAPSPGFGRSVAIEGALVVAGMPGYYSTDGIRGAAVIYEQGPTGWSTEVVNAPENIASPSTGAEYGIHVEIDEALVAVSTWYATPELGVDLWGSTCAGWQRARTLTVPQPSPGGSGTTSAIALEGSRLVTANFPVASSYDLLCSLGQHLCDPNTENVTGLSGRLRAIGSLATADNTFSLTASQLPPSSIGIMILGPNHGQSTYGNCWGELCLTAPIARIMPAQVANAQGALTHDFDLLNLPASLGGGPVQAGQTWNFQYWYRNPNPARPATFTNGVQVTFQ